MTYRYGPIVCDLTEGCLDVLELDLELFQNVGKLLAQRKRPKYLSWVIGRA